MPYMATFTINIPQMLAHIPYMDPMGYTHCVKLWSNRWFNLHLLITLN